MPNKNNAEADRVLVAGRPDYERCDNVVVSARYTLYNFLPVAIVEQFRRFANVYFLVMGGVMFIGQYTDLYDTAISPWTTLGPLCLVISVSLLVEGLSDYKRHLNDHQTNFAPCTILDTVPNPSSTEGQKSSNNNKNEPPEPPPPPVTVHDTTIHFTTVKRMDIRQGHFCLVKNREMVPADMVLLASSNELGGAYIETSSIDGETNLKLRTLPCYPVGSQYVPDRKESLDTAVNRLTLHSALVHPEGTSILQHADLEKLKQTVHEFSVENDEDWNRKEKNHPLQDQFKKLKQRRPSTKPAGTNDDDGTVYLPALTTEPPNASVHTFSGKLTLHDGSAVPLDHDNVLLRGAVIRNTEWIIGWSFFTGTDTKLVQNSFDTPSKFSQLDQLINKTVLAILLVMFLCVFYLATQAVRANDDAFDFSFYVGYGSNATEPWPYLPNLPPPEWRNGTRNWIQFYLLYLTLLNNFVPLSLYISVEMVQFFMLWLVNSDLEMYDDTTNTRALARSTIISDLGRIEYIFSDKTGTLTQNVMRFKRCSVDGMIFGAPIQKSKPGQSVGLTSAFHPLRQLLVGKFEKGGISDKLTFNSEMFLRVMSLCHTVVVEKDIDKKENAAKATKSSDGAPLGFAFQAESPDEGALVSAASRTYDFQVVTRDSSGIRLKTTVPSHLQDEKLVKGLKNKKASIEKVAMETAHEDLDGYVNNTLTGKSGEAVAEREEVWTILAVNKFDSDRKRMSILLRSPDELGGLPILFCKGADSAMIDPEICGKAALINETDKPKSGLTTVSEDEADQGDEMEHMLRMQVHLGEFAKEGLRTLVLGMKVLTESECSAWLDVFNSAATSISNREELLTQAAKEIERDLHIVGATAIEDKLQKNVPQTIATLEKAGIKLWVLTGDKRETAVEIGYATHVLTSKMHLTEVPDKGKDHVRTQMAMEFIRLIKIGRLREYQKATLGGENQNLKFKERVSQGFSDISFAIGKCRRSIWRAVVSMLAMIYGCLGLKNRSERARDLVSESALEEKSIIKAIERRSIVRKIADKTIRDWLRSEEGMKQRQRRSSEVAVEKGQDDDDTMLASEEPSGVFLRASSAQHVLQDMANSGELSQPEIRQLSIAHLTAHQVGTAESEHDEPIVDEDTLSLQSFVPGGVGDKADFDRKKRTALERMFAVDRAVRKGRLKKHMTSQRLSEIQQARDTGPKSDGDLANNRNAARALVIEGAALKHLLNDPDFPEEILFAVASSCDAVIACRVSPRQKAQLVNLVRENISPEPITLAIGDGANDVGMIQEAHVGIGISGKEGTQAVNASDFAIAQFRFLEPLILIHGRWNFFRLSTVVLFSFYKNAVMAGTIIIFTERTLYSGTPLYDEWIMAMLNFVAAWPIVFTGLFDRTLSKEYVRNHPEVYGATRENQLITVRSLIRWIILCFVHVFVLYYFTVPQQSFGGGISPAFHGLMRNEDSDHPGIGEGGDLKSVGTVTFTSMIFLMAYKVLYETRSLVHGRWPFCRCRKDVDESWIHRFPYTWFGATFLSILFFLACLAIYQLVGVQGASQFSGFTMTANQVMSTRSMSWLLILFVPILGMVFDVTGKVFSNMFYPTQTQVHLEQEAVGKMLRRRRQSRRRTSLPGPRVGEIEI